MFTWAHVTARLTPGERNKNWKEVEVRAVVGGEVGVYCLIAGGLVMVVLRGGLEMRSGGDSVCFNA